jgi:hypothetical protein
VRYKLGLIIIFALSFVQPLLRKMLRSSIVVVDADSDDHPLPPATAVVVVVPAVTAVASASASLDLDRVAVDATSTASSSTIAVAAPVEVPFVQPPPVVASETVLAVDQNRPSHPNNNNNDHLEGGDVGSSEAAIHVFRSGRVYSPS